MALASLDLIRARETAARLLDALNLDAYLFEVEPGEQGWLLRIECATEEGWNSRSVPVNKESLLAASDDPVAYGRLLEEWRQCCKACKPAPGSG